MTIDEAISVMNVIVHMLEPQYDTDRIEDAVEMAIKALEQEPCGDAISRSAVLDINEHHHGQMPNHVNHEIWKEIKALPSVTPQPKMGRWSHDGSHWENRFICSECRYKLFDEQTNYCPNCGAKMSEIPTGAEGREK